MQQRFDVPSGASATVSVATLRVPDKAWKHFSKAKAASEHNRPEESGREIAQAIAIAPDFAQAYLLRADLQIKAHAFAAAIDSVAEARRVEPEIPLAGIVLAGAYNGLAQYAEAIAVLEHIHGWEAQSWQASYERARAATGTRDTDAALYWSARCLELAPRNFVDVHLVRANALMAAREWSEAELQLQTYLNSPGDLLHREQVSTALIAVRERASQTLHQEAHTDELVKVASR
jgi:tetratricopeptide (TPR) repeat protein